MRLINLTPHAISLANEAGENIQTIPASGVVAWVSMTVCDTGRRVARIPVVVQEPGQIENLPEPDGNVYIVSIVVLGAIQGRADVVAPDTGPGSVVRDDIGRIIAVRRFIGKEG